MVREDKIFQI